MVHQSGEFVEVKHRVVLAVLAKERHVLTQIHVLEMVRNKTAVAALYPLSEFFQQLFLIVVFH
jgi:hypothetical protein